MGAETACRRAHMCHGCVGIGIDAMKSFLFAGALLLLTPLIANATNSWKEKGEKKNTNSPTTRYRMQVWAIDSSYQAQSIGVRGFVSVSSTPGGSYPNLPVYTWERAEDIVYDDYQMVYGVLEVQYITGGPWTPIDSRPYTPYLDPGPLNPPNNP